MSATPSWLNRASEIPLRRLPSASSKYTTFSKDTNPFSDPSSLTAQNPFSDDDDASTLASTTLGILPKTPFTPTSTLQIQTSGKSLISFPLPSKELTIPVFSPDTGRPVYLSLRATRRSGNSRLVLADDETETSIAITTYWFGPGRSPVIRIFSNSDNKGEPDEVD